MVARDWTARDRLSFAGLHLAGTGPPTAICRRCRFGKARAASSRRLPVCLGIESAQNSGRNSQVGGDLEGAGRFVKKVLLTLIQLAVTIGVLYWVFHDAEKRTQML